MFEMVLNLLEVILLTARLSAAITPHTPHLSDEQRVEYSGYMVMAGQMESVDPFLIAAVMWHESRFTNAPRNRTNDYGLMQVHWQKQGPRERWLRGLTPADLMDPKKNILAGAIELAHLRWYCKAKGDTGHDWWGHYKHGVVVRSEDYGKKILWRYKVLSQYRPRPPRPQRPPRPAT